MTATPARSRLSLREDKEFAEIRQENARAAPPPRRRPIMDDPIFLPSAPDSNAAFQALLKPPCQIE
jgi:hypothetical protein